VGLGKIPSSSSYLEWLAISRFRGTPEKRHESCQIVDIEDRPEAKNLKKFQ